MTVYRRGDRWVAKVWGDGRWEWLGTYPTKKEARAVEQSHMPAKGGQSLTVDDFCDVWLRDYARPASNTNRTARYALNGFRRELGRRRLSSIDRPEAQRWAKRAPYSNYKVVRTMFADALRDGLVPQNPFSQLRIPVPEGRRQLDVLSEEQIEKLATHALTTYPVDKHGPILGPTIRALILTAGFTGLRPAELAALDWGDVDLERGLLHVREAIGGDGETKDPKTWAGRRICVLPPAAHDALAALDRHEGTQAVFLTPRGRRFGKGSWHRYFVPVRSAFGRPDVTPYALRHACATLLLERGLSPEDVAAQLGHKDGGGLVRRLYGHPDEQRQRDRIALAFAEVPDTTKAVGE